MYSGEGSLTEEYVRYPIIMIRDYVLLFIPYISAKAYSGRRHPCMGDKFEVKCHERNDFIELSVKL